MLEGDLCCRLGSEAASLATGHLQKSRKQIFSLFLPRCPDLALAFPKRFNLVLPTKLIALSSLEFVVWGAVFCLHRRGGVGGTEQFSKAPRLSSL